MKSHITKERIAEIKHTLSLIFKTPVTHFWVLVATEAPFNQMVKQEDFNQILAAVDLPSPLSQYCNSVQLSITVNENDCIVEIPPVKEKYMHKDIAYKLDILLSDNVVAGVIMENFNTYINATSTIVPKIKFKLTT